MISAGRNSDIKIIYFIEFIINFSVSINDITQL